MKRQNLVEPQWGEEGIALVTTLVILLIMTVLGVGAVAVTALENRIAGFQRTGESATSAAESCIGTSVNIIKQTVAASNTVPPAFYLTANDPVPALAAPSLGSEISGTLPNNADTVIGIGAAGPDYRQVINGYEVRGDIDFLYPQSTAGEDQTESVKTTKMYRIDCFATLPAVGAESHVIVVYACEIIGGICKTNPL